MTVSQFTLGRVGISDPHAPTERPNQTMERTAPGSDV